MAEKKYTLEWRPDMTATVSGDHGGWDMRCVLAGGGDDQIVLHIAAFHQDRKFGSYNINTGRRAFDSPDEAQNILNAHPEAIGAAIDDARAKLQRFLNKTAQQLDMRAQC